MERSTNQRNKLLIIDPQIDFHPGGSLAVTGANEDSARIAQLIAANVDEIDEIIVTLDTHHVSIPNWCCLCVCVWISIR